MPAVDAKWPDGSVSYATTNPNTVAQVLWYGGMLFKQGTTERITGNLVGVGASPNPDDWVIYTNGYDSHSAVPLRDFLAGNYDVALVPPTTASALTNTGGSSINPVDPTVDVITGGIDPTKTWTVSVETPPFVPPGTYGAGNGGQTQQPSGGGSLGMLALLGLGLAFFNRKRKA